MPDREVSVETWHSPHGTTWQAETYEEALEAERDSLAAQLEEAQKRERVLRDNLGAAPHPNLVGHPVYTVWYESSRDALDSPQTQGGSDE